MKTIISHSIYEGNPWGNGAEKHTAQLDELFEQWHIRRVKYSRNGRSRLSISTLLRAVGIIASVYSVFRFSSIRSIARLWKNLARELPGIDRFFDGKSEAFFWESTREYFYYLPFIAKKRRLKVIAFAHNLESLVPGQRTMFRHMSLIERLDKEIKILKACDIVCAVSREDTLMLKLLGIDSIYLPYYPPKAVEDWLLSIRSMREHRSNTDEKRILAIGSTINPPTSRGTEELLKLFEKVAPQNCRLFVGGFGADVLARDIGFSEGNTTILGELSIGALQKEMILADALLICQPATTGALTRITEFLIAGIPVVVNFDAARNYYGVEGVHVYHDEAEMFDLLKRELCTPPAIERPIAEFDAFKERISSLN